MKQPVQNTPKDFWDKLSIVASLVASVLIASVGLVFTIYYQRSEAANRRLLQDQEVRQEAERVQINKIELVTKLMPDLRSKDKEVQRQALLAVKALGDTKLMTALALNDSGPGAQEALLAVSRSPESSGAEKEIASWALTRIQVAENLAKSILQISSINADKTSTLATGFVWHQSNLVVTCLHAVLGARKILGRSGSNVYELTISKVLPAADLALLQSSQAIQSEPLQEDTRAATEGAAVVLGYPLGVSTPLSTVVRLRLPARPLKYFLPPDAAQQLEKVRMPDTNEPVLSFEGPVAAGESGAPVVSADGKVVAIVIGGASPIIAWAMPTGRLRDLLTSGEKLPSTKTTENPF